MHLEVKASAPGFCPHCGMALEPLLPTTATRDPELAKLARRILVAGLLVLPLIALSVLKWLPAEANIAISATTLRWLQFALATPVVLYCGFPFFARAGEAISRGGLNMFTLISIGVGAAWLTSVMALLAPQHFPASFRLASGALPLYFESAAMIVTLVLLGQALETRARARNHEALGALLALTPRTAFRLGAGGSREVPLEDLRAGDFVRVRPGERVPADGLVTEGESALDEALLTGEAMPHRVCAGDAVRAGSINREGVFVFRIEQTGADTLLANIVQQASEAQRSRAPVQRMVDFVSSVFVPLVVAVAIAAAIAWAQAGPAPRAAHALLAAVSVLIIACPCALGLATPMSILCAMARGANCGLLFQNAAVLERLCDADTLVIDKTGTLTRGRPVLMEVLTLNGWRVDDVVKLAASLEQASEHPLAQAILKSARERGFTLSEPFEVNPSPGRGLSGYVGERHIAVGSAAYFTSLALETLDTPSLRAAVAELHAVRRTVVHVAVDKRVVALLGITDPLRDDTARAMELLREDGLRVIIASGDTRANIQSVARALGLSEVHAELLPGKKLELVQRLQEEGRVVAMAGDGINDAPAIAQADIGIAMGSGADLAKKNADITLVHGDLRGLARARKLSRAARNNIRQNLLFAFGYNALAIPLAAGALYPATGMLLSPTVAAAAMSLSSISVIANAQRLRKSPI